MDRIEKYAGIYNELIPSVGKLALINSKIQIYKTNLDKFKETANHFPGMPPEVPGLLCMRESDFDFSCHLANGDSLEGDTFHVPKGIMAPLPPPYTWEEAAIAALEDHIKGWNFNLKSPGWVWDIPHIMYFCQAYHGFGCEIEHNALDSYLIGCSNLYEKGGYENDGDWVEDWVDKQPGVATMLKVMGFR